MSTFYGRQCWIQWKIGDDEYGCEGLDETLAIVHALRENPSFILDPASIDIHTAIAVADTSSPEYQYGPVTKLENHVVVPVIMTPMRLKEWHAFAMRHLYAYKVDKD
jgi:hypothetical protein